MKKKLIFITSIFLIYFTTNLYASDYPNTSIAIIDTIEILNNSKVAINANEQIEEISIRVQEELANNEKKILDEQKKLIEAQSIMAPEAFEEKRIEYEKSVQDFQIKSQNTLVALDNKVAMVRAQILDEVRPILEQIAEEKGITSTNVDEMLNSKDPETLRLLGVTKADTGAYGSWLGLDDDWAYQIIKQVGNYSESFEKHIGVNTPINIARGLNALYKDGGILYAPPFR